MSETEQTTKQIVPKRFILFIASLILFFLVVVFGFTLADMPLFGVAPESEVLSEKKLNFKPNGRKSVSVYDSDGKLLLKSDQNNNGFIGVVYSAIERERIKKRVKSEDFLRLVLYENGRVALVDDATELEIHLNSFGEKNVAVFGSLFVK